MLMHAAPDPAINRSMRDVRYAGISKLSVLLLSALALLGDGTLEPIGVVTALCFAAAMGGLMAVALRSGLLIVATLVLTVGMAFANGLALAASIGIVKLQIRASAEAVQFGVFLVVLFQGTLVGVCSFGARKLRRSVTHVPPNTGAAIWLFFAGTFVAALIAGTWTYYGGERIEVAPGAFQLDYLYIPTLLALFAESLHRRNKAAGLVSAALFFLIFATQMRRLMMTAVIFGALTMLRRHRLPWGKLALGGVAAVLLVSVGSAAWRSSSEEFNTNDVSERLADAFRRVGQLEGVGEQLKERTTVFLWLNAITAEYAPSLQGTISMPELFITTAWTAVPGLLAPAKYDVEQVSCETSLSVVGLAGIDLACTPEAEAYLAAGIPAVIGLAVFWGVFLLAVESLWGRSSMGTLLAAHLFFFCSFVETGAFPQIYGLRSAALTFLLVAPLAGVLRRRRQWRNTPADGSSQNASSHRRRHWSERLREEVLDTPR